MSLTAKTCNAAARLRGGPECDHGRLLVLAGHVGCTHAVALSYEDIAGTRSLKGTIGTRSMLTILGVHKVPPEVALTRSSDANEPHNKDLDNLWLIELSIDPLMREFNQEDFTQALDDMPRDEWQIAYMEVFLSDDGTRAQGARLGVKNRLMFFFHYLDISMPIMTPLEEVALPKPTPLPSRLRPLIKYIEPC